MIFKKRVHACLILTLATVVQTAPVFGADAKRRCVAFVVGVEKYDEPSWDKLKWVAEDAQRFWDQLGSIANLDKRRSALLVADRDLYDAIPPKATVALSADGSSGSFDKIGRGDLETRWEKFVEKIESGDLVVVFFGGHGGLRDDDPNGEQGVHFLVSDSEKVGQGFSKTFRVNEDLSAKLKTKIAASDLHNVNVAFFADMCHAGAAGSKGATPENDKPLRAAAKKVHDDFGGRAQFAYFPACAGSEEAFEPPGKKGSLFVRAVLDGLKGGARDATSKVTTGSLLKFVRKNLEGKQTVPEIPGFAMNIEIGRPIAEELRVRRLWAHALIAVAKDLEQVNPFRSMSLLKMAELQLVARESLSLKANDVDQRLIRWQLARLQGRRLVELEDRVIEESLRIATAESDGLPGESLAATIKGLTDQIQSLAGTTWKRRVLVFSLNGSYMDATGVPQAVDNAAREWTKLFGEQPDAIRMLKRPEKPADVGSVWGEILKAVTDERSRSPDAGLVVIINGGFFAISDDKSLPYPCLSTEQFRQLWELLGRNSTLVWDIFPSGAYVAEFAKKSLPPNADQSVFVTVPDPKAARFYFPGLAVDPLLAILHAKGFRQSSYDEYFEGNLKNVAKSEWATSKPISIGREPTGVRVHLATDYGIPDAWWTIRTAIEPSSNPWDKMPINLPNANAVSVDASTVSVPASGVPESINGGDPFRILRQACLNNQSTQNPVAFAKAAAAIQQLEPKSFNSYLQPAIERFGKFKNQLSQRIKRPTGRSKMVYVLIAAQDFRSPLIGRLQFSRRDTRLWSDALKLLDQDLTVEIVEPESEAQVTRKDFEAALTRAKSQTEKEDTLLVVYSGRGYQAADGARYIALEDTRLDGEEEFLEAETPLKEGNGKPLAAAVDSEPWNVNELLQLLNDCRGRCLVIFDCQFSTPLRLLPGDPPAPVIKHLGALVSERPPGVATAVANRGRFAAARGSQRDFFWSLESSPPFLQPVLNSQFWDASNSPRPENSSRLNRNARIPNPPALSNDRLTMIWWAGTLAEIPRSNLGISVPNANPVMAGVFPQTQYVPFSEALVQSLIQTDGQRLFLGSVEEWVSLAQRRVPRSRTGYVPNSYDYSYDGNTDYEKNTGYERNTGYEGYVVQGPLNRHPFYGTEMGLTWQEIVAELPRREMNLAVAQAIGDQEMSLLSRPCDVLARAVIALADAELRKEVDSRVDKTKLQAMHQALNSQREGLSRDDLKDVLPILALTQAEMQTLLGDASRAVKQLAEQLPDLAAGEFGGYLVERFQALIHTAIADNSDNLLQDLDDVLQSQNGAANVQPTIDGVRNGLKQQLRANRNDFLPMKPEKAKPRKRRQSILGGLPPA